MGWVRHSLALPAPGGSFVTHRFKVTVARAKIADRLEPQVGLHQARGCPSIELWLPSHTSPTVTPRWGRSENPRESY